MSRQFSKKRAVKPDNGAKGGPVDLMATAKNRWIPSSMLIGLFVLAIFYTIYFTTALLIPIVLATLFYLLLAPVVRALKRYLRLPNGLAAGLVVLMLLASVVAGFYSLSDPAARWLRDLPVAAAELKWKLYPLRQPVEELQGAVAKLQEIAQDATSGDVQALLRSYRSG